jgi:hypothetical protein
MAAQAQPAAGAAPLKDRSLSEPSSAIARVMAEIEGSSGASRANLSRSLRVHLIDGQGAPRLRHHGTKIEAYHRLNGLRCDPRAFPCQFPATVSGREFGAQKIPCHAAPKSANLDR